jgi:hypothetical protein
VLDHQDELRVRVVVIAFAPADSLARYQRRQGLDGLLVLSDPERRAYQALEFGRGSIARVWLHPRLWLRYAQLLLQGRRPERAQDDTLQLGGDVLVDADGRIRWIYASKGPEDRPAISQIRRAIAGGRSREAARRETR